ncbi:hypothetical protein [Ancylobacter oerskovii]|uniref:Uncharacterized protein n=2 Tax=Ancylobacter oerskovii TaxID=459519 RepID=A0ABW4YRT9_9HYPH
MAAKRKKIFRKPTGQWKGQGTATFNHQTIHRLVIDGLLTERNNPSLHVIATTAGCEFLANLEKGRRRG